MNTEEYRSNMRNTRNTKKRKPNRRTSKNKKRLRKNHKKMNNESNVDMINDFDSNGIVILGLIYAEWCPHCLNMKPEWNKMKNEFNGNHHYNVVEIEADQQDKQERIAELESKLNGKTINAAGYPTIFKLKNGDIEYYGGNRVANDIKSWVTNSHSGGFQIDKHRELNRRRSNNLTPKHTPFAPRKKYKSKSRSYSRYRSRSRSKRH